MSFQVQISTGGKLPIYRQITDQVRMAVATSRLEPGEAMPSVRAQAERLLVNPNTVARAYNDLIRDGVLRSEQGRGVFVNGVQASHSKAERQRRLQPLLEALVHESVALRCEPEEVRALLEKKLSQWTSKE